MPRRASTSVYDRLWGLPDDGLVLLTATSRMRKASSLADQDGATECPWHEVLSQSTSSQGLWRDVIRKANSIARCSDSHRFAMWLSSQATFVGELCITAPRDASLAIDIDRAFLSFSDCPPTWHRISMLRCSPPQRVSEAIDIYTAPGDVAAVREYLRTVGVTRHWATPPIPSLHHALCRVTIGVPNELAGASRSWPSQATLELTSKLDVLCHDGLISSWKLAVGVHEVEVNTAVAVEIDTSLHRVARSSGFDVVVRMFRARGNR